MIRGIRELRGRNRNRGKLLAYMAAGGCLALLGMGVIVYAFVGLR